MREPIRDRERLQHILEAETLYSTTKESLRTQAYRRYIPTNRELAGRTVQRYILTRYIIQT